MLTKSKLAIAAALFLQCFSAAQAGKDAGPGGDGRLCVGSLWDRGWAEVP